MRLLIAFVLLVVGAFLFSVATAPLTGAANWACGLWFIALLLLTSKFGHRGEQMLIDAIENRPRRQGRYRMPVHPTATVRDGAVIIQGDVENLLNKMPHYLNGSGGRITKLKAGGWKFEHPLADPHEVAKAINDNSDRL